MEKLKEKLGKIVVEVEVVLKVPDGANSSIAPRLLGQAVCLEDANGHKALLTSAFLVEDSASLRLRTRRSLDWTSARVADVFREAGVATLEAEDEDFECPLARPAQVELEAPHSVLLSIDNPVAHTSIFFGEVYGPAESPLTQHLLTGFGLPLGGPLFSTEGKLAALNLRRYTATSKLNLAASATLLKRLLLGRRRQREETQREARRSPLFSFSARASWGTMPVTGATEGNRCLNNF